MLIKNGMKGWKALQRWQDNEYLRKKIGKNVVGVEMAKDNTFRFYGGQFKERTMTVSRFLDLAFDHVNATQYKLYIAQQDIRDVFPQLMKDLQVPHFAAHLDVDELLLWMGSGGQLTPLHYDHSENVMALISGSKTFTIYEPSDINFLYPTVKGPNSAVSSELDTLEDIDLERFPLYRHARNYTVRLEAGDFFYLPSNWWHEVRSHGRNIAVNFWYATHTRWLSHMFDPLMDRFERDFYAKVEAGELEHEPDGGREDIPYDPAVDE